MPCSKLYRKSVSEEANANLSVTVVPSSRCHFDYQGCFQLNLLLRTSLSSYAFIFFFIAYPTWWTCGITSVSSQLLYCVLWTLMSPPRKLKYLRRGGREQRSRNSSIVCSFRCAGQVHGAVCKQSNLPRLRTGTILGNPNTLLAY